MEVCGMARNRHPEETVKKILDVSLQLFLEKGYEKATLADIIRETGLSKGAIYHHFASKEEILIRICDKIGEENERDLRAIRDDKTMNGQQKLRAVFRASLLSENQETMMNLVPTMLENPRFLVMEIKSLYEEAVPYYLEPIVREGIEDGSIRTEYPQETAEALILLSDLWLTPKMKPTTEAEMRARCTVYNQIAESFGMEDLLDTELIEVMVRLCNMIWNCENRGQCEE